MSLSAAILLSSGVAHAQQEKAEAPREQLGDQRQLVLSVERLIAIDAQLPRTFDASYGDVESKWTESNTTFTVLSRPAVAVDGFVWRHVSFGAKALLGGGNYRHEGRTVDEDGPRTNSNHAFTFGFSLVPRVGAAVTSESGLGVWARAGFIVNFNSSANTQSDRQGKYSYRQSDVSYGAEGQLLLTYSPLHHLAVMAGPYCMVTFADRGPSLYTAGFTVNAGIFL